MSLHLDIPPEGQKKWVEENGMYLFATRTEEWARNTEKLRLLHDQCGRPVANIAERHIGIPAKDAPLGTAGGLLRKT